MRCADYRLNARGTLSVVYDHAGHSRIGECLQLDLRDLVVIERMQHRLGALANLIGLALQFRFVVFRACAQRTVAGLDKQRANVA